MKSTIRTECKYMYSTMVGVLGWCSVLYECPGFRVTKGDFLIFFLNRDNYSSFCGFNINFTLELPSFSGCNPETVCILPRCTGCLKIHYFAIYFKSREPMSLHILLPFYFEGGQPNSYCDAHFEQPFRPLP